MVKSKRILLIMFMMVLGFALVPSVQSEAAVKLDKKKVTLYVGKTTTLKVKGTSQKAKWSSSNKKVATVSSKGKVKAKKKGNATITAQIGKKKYKCKVTVKNNSKSLKSISLNTTSLQMKSGEKSILTVKYNPSNTTDNKTVNWQTSNPSCVSVDSNGNVSALQEGNALITATVGKYSATCTVSVTKAGVLSNTSISLEYPNTYRLLLTNAIATKWTSSDSEVVTVNDDGTVTSVKAGTAIVTCYDSYNNIYSCSVNVTYPNITIQSISNVYETIGSTRYYYMKILVTNNTSSQVKINHAAMIYAYNSISKAMVAYNSDLEIISESREVTINSGSSAYIYGLEGKTSYTLYSSGCLGLYVEYNGVTYIVITDSAGKIDSMSVYSK